MHANQPKVLSRVMGRMRRLSIRAQERVRGLPIRASHRKEGLPIPPGRLIHLVAGTEDVTWFLESGARGADCLRATLARNGVRLEELDSILDFGCGVGRVLRHLSTPNGPSLHGTDYNRDLIGWCVRNLGFAQFQVNGLDSRLDVPDQTFDFIYALSVFTHLTEARQRFWIDELSRVLRPGGHLFITIHGEVYLPRLTDYEQALFRSGRLVTQGGRREGSNDCAAFHPESYVRGTLARNLTVVDFIPEGALGNPQQDVYLLRKPL